MDNTLTLEQQFLELKEMEAEIKERRFALETKIARAYQYDTLSGKSKRFITENANGENFDVQFSASQVKKVDYEKLREIQTQCSIPQQEIERLFRLKAEVNSSEFNALPEANKDILNSAITVQINKPTLKITLIKKD
jgi:pyruvate dehydrogenase complex dehydrogenase (E1) component